MERLGSESGIRETESGVELGQAPEFDWIVIFRDVVDAGPFWWDYVFHTRKGFRHVCAIAYQPNSYHWIYVDWTSKYMQTWIYHPQRAKDVIEWAKKDANATLVSYRPRQDKNSVFNIPVLFCTEAMKHLLGIKRFFIWTPWQLYKYLMRTGGTEIHRGQWK